MGAALIAAPLPFRRGTLALTTYDGLFDHLGLREWCDAEKSSDGPISMADLLAKAKGSAAPEAWWEFSFPSLDTLNKACASFPQSRDVTKGVEDGFLAIKDALRIVLDPLTQPLSWMLELALLVVQVAPWWLMFLLLSLIVYFASKSIRMVVFVATCLGFLAFIDHYDHRVG